MITQFFTNSDIFLIVEYFKPIKHLTKTAVDKFFKHFPDLKYKCESCFKQYPEVESLRQCNSFNCEKPTIT